MAPWKHLLTLPLALSVLAICGTAHAEIITYQFTADIAHASDSTDVLGMDAGDTVNGTFSFDTEAESYVRDGRRVDVAYHSTGEIETDAVVIEGGSTGVWIESTVIQDAASSDRDILSVTNSGYNSDVTNLTTGATTDARFSVESVTFYFGDADALSGTDLPESLNLEEFDSATYVVQVTLNNGHTAYAIGSITSLTRVGGSEATAVPELSASGMVSSLAVILGSAYVIVNRRREGALES